MSKIFYNKKTGLGAVFDNSANISDWPDFQTDPVIVIANAIQVRSQRNKLLESSDEMALADRITDE